MWPKGGFTKVMIFSKGPGRSTCSEKESNVTGHEDHQPTLGWGSSWISLSGGHLVIITDHLVTVLADEGEGKVGSHEEHQVAHQ